MKITNLLLLTAANGQLGKWTMSIILYGPYTVWVKRYDDASFDQPMEAENPLKI